jgi:protein-tyrosine-phosphatase
MQLPGLNHVHGLMQVRILLISESNVCRSVLAEALLRRLLKEQGLQEEVVVCAKVCSQGV